MELKYIDIHSHLNLSPLSLMEDEVIAHMEEAGVGAITVGVDLATSREAIRIAEKKEFLYATVGLHPTDNTNEVFEAEAYKMLAEHKKVVAIGECGLDYFRKNDSETKSRQMEIFKKHIAIAIELNKPLMIHARPSKGSMDAYEDVLHVLERYKKDIPTLKGNFHFFVGDIAIAKRILALGFTVSFDGPITFTDEYNEVITFVPLESLHAETDAPFAAPVPYRGQTNEPTYVIEIIKKIAEIKKLPLELVERQLFSNAKRYFF